MDGAAPNRGDGFDVSLVGRDSPSFTESVFGAPKAKGEEDTAGSAGFEGVPKENGVLGVAGAAGVAPHGVVPVGAGADGLQAPPEQAPVRRHRLPQRHLEDHEAPAPVRRHVPCTRSQSREVRFC